MFFVVCKKFSTDFFDLILTALALVLFSQHTLFWSIRFMTNGLRKPFHLWGGDLLIATAIVIYLQQSFLIRPTVLLKLIRALKDAKSICVPQVTNWWNLSMHYLYHTENGRHQGIFSIFRPVKVDWIITNKQGVNMWRVLHTRQYSTPIEYRWVEPSPEDAADIIRLSFGSKQYKIRSVVVCWRIH